MKNLITILLITISGLAYAQPKITTYRVNTDTLASRATDKILDVVDTVRWPNGTLQFAGRDFGQTLVPGAIPFGGTNNKAGGVFRNSTLLNFDSTNKYLGVGLATPAATIHGRGSSAVSGLAFQLQNSTPNNLVSISNVGVTTFGANGGTSHRIDIYGGINSTDLIAGYNNSGGSVFYVNCSGAGSIGAAGTQLGNWGFKLNPTALGNTNVGAIVAGIKLIPSITAGANNQTLTSFYFKDSIRTPGAFTGLTYNTLDIRNAGDTSLLKINYTNGPPTATFTIPVKTTQLIGGTTFQAGATVTMTTERTHLCTSGSSTTTVNFPASPVEGLEICIINQTAGGLTVTAHNDYTGASQTTQAAQSKVCYLYINAAWNRL